MKKTMYNILTALLLGTGIGVFAAGLVNAVVLYVATMYGLELEGSVRGSLFFALIGAWVATSELRDLAVAKSKKD